MQKDEIAIQIVKNYCPFTGDVLIDFIEDRLPIFGLSVTTPLLFSYSDRHGYGVRVGDFLDAYNE